VPQHMWQGAVLITDTNYTKMWFKRSRVRDALSNWIALLLKRV